jgi:zinc transport system ATP-binding protein
MPSPTNDPRGETLPLFEFEDVNFSYHGTLVLKDLSFQVFPGEFIGIIGPNGGGKTTLLKLILGFLKPSRGSIKMGHPLKSQPLKIAYVPQSIRFDREFPISVNEVVLSGLMSRLPWYGHFKKEDREAAQQALETIGLPHLADKAFGTLSGGQAQRVLIARALVSKPELLLLDEPTASVDTQAEADIYALLKQLKGNMTILMVTHDLGVAIEQVERVLCVQGGIMQLKPEEVCKHFAFGLFHKPLLPSSTSPLPLV